MKGRIDCLMMGLCGAFLFWVGLTCWQMGVKAHQELQHIETAQLLRACASYARGNTAPASYTDKASLIQEMCK